jgi:hypothetical protein
LRVPCTKKQQNHSSETGGITDRTTTETTAYNISSTTPTCAETALALITGGAMDRDIIDTQSGPGGTTLGNITRDTSTTEITIEQEPPDPALDVEQDPIDLTINVVQDPTDLSLNV